MRIKTILSLVAFIAAFGLSLLFAGVPQNNFYSKFQQRQNSRNARQNIMMFLRQDIDNGYLRGQKISYLDSRAKKSQTGFDIAPYADATTEYVDASESIRVSGLPNDFTAAWLEHMNAWREHADYLNEKKSSGVKYTVNGREIIQYSVNPNDENLYRLQSAEIDRTWYKTLRIARKYGAVVNEY